MQRAIALANQGLGHTSPNPLVGCVIVYAPGTPEEKILAEGYHRQAGCAHAELEALRSVDPKDLDYLPQSTAYVTLEPCHHTGKTPPCTEALLQAGIGRVVIGVKDPDSRVNGLGMSRLREAGVQVEMADEASQKEVAWVNRRYLTAVTHLRPYIILKWAESSDGFVDGERSVAHPGPWPITGPLANATVHRWRSQEDAILVGIGTVLADNPQLTVREVDSPSPQRVVLGPESPLDCGDFHVLKAPKALFWPSSEDLRGELHVAFSNGWRSLFVEGGPTTHRLFLSENLWDEIRIFKAPHTLQEGVQAPSPPTSAIPLPHGIFPSSFGSDSLHVYTREKWF